MPVGVLVVEARLAADEVSLAAFTAAIETFRSGRWRGDVAEEHCFKHLTITRDAFAGSTEREINQFRTFLATARLDAPLRKLLEMACLSVWVLQRGKGNSSQQMGTHGRNELRKCAYVWRR